MTLKYGKFQLPNRIVIEEKGSDDTYAKVVAEPFERGYGHTLGNSLRRIMLTSIEAPAIISLSIEGVPHEYMAVDGIVEDMTNIVLNFKNALLRKLDYSHEAPAGDLRILTSSFEVTKEDLDKANGQVSIQLKDIVDSSTFEVINPNLHLFSVTQPMKKEVNLRIAMGRGYVPSERHQIADRYSNEIVLDSIFTPVRMVNYFVENTRVGQNTEYDRLVFEIHTDGRVTPEEALSFAAQISEAHFGIFDKIQSYTLSFEEEQQEQLSDDDEMLDKLCLKIDEIELSVRSTNCLSGANIETIAELVSIPDRKMLEFRNFGKKSLNEIKDKLTSMSLHLGMDLSRFGITQDNVKDKMKQLIEQRRGKKEAALSEEEVG